MGKVLELFRLSGGGNERTPQPGGAGEVGAVIGSAWDPAEAEARVEAAVDEAAGFCPGEAVAWAAEARPDLLEKVFTAERHTDEAYRAEDMAGLEAALGEYLEACRALAEEYATATDHARREWAAGECPVERLIVDRRAGVLTLVPKAGASPEDREAFLEWIRGEFGLAGMEIRWGDGVTTRLEKKGQLVFLPGVKGQQEEFRSPWLDWLDSVEIIRVGDLAAWREVLAEARSVGVCAVDTETTGLDPLQHRVRLVQLAVPVYPSAGPKRLVAADGKGPEAGGGAKVYVLDLFALPEEERREALEALAELVADPHVSKAGCNWKFDLSFIRAALGRRLACERLFDVMLASQLCTAGDFIPGGQWEKWVEEHGYRFARNDRGQELKTKLLDQHGHLVEFEHDNAKEIKPFYPTHSLQQVAHRHLEVWLSKEYQDSDWRGELSEEQIRYAALDAAVLLPLREILAYLLGRNKLIQTAKIEFTCIPATVEIENTGMPFDAPRARELRAQAETEAARHREELTLLAKETGFQPKPKKGGKKNRTLGFNPDSSVDVLDCLRLLAERENLLVGDKLVAGGEEFPLESRDETLSRLVARLPEGSILRRFAGELKAYRAAKKRADFLRRWLEYLHPADDRLHPDLRQINPQGVGRFSASNPNLQQAPRGSEIRALFKPPEGRKLVVADYSAIEMRIMCQLSGDQTMRQAFREGVDIHKFTAGKMAGKSPEEVTKEERQAAKAFNFGLIYGMQGKTLQNYAEVSYGVKSFNPTMVL